MYKDLDLTSVLLLRLIGRTVRIRLVKKTFLLEDDIAFRFVRVLDEVGVRYVVVAQYVAILFGRL